MKNQRPTTAHGRGIDELDLVDDAGDRFARRFLRRPGAGKTEGNHTDGERREDTDWLESDTHELIIDNHVAWPDGRPRLQPAPLVAAVPPDCYT